MDPHAQVEIDVFCTLLQTSGLLVGAIGLQPTACAPRAMSSGHVEPSELLESLWLGRRRL